MAVITPMMQQYIDIKEQNKDAILLFRLGDFYEMFFEDAITASKELEITLTGRDCGLDERAPMCGVPHHAVNSYINKLISKGYKVAICEQLEDPALAKGLVKRDIVRIITPGTVIDNNALEENKNNYIAGITKLDYAFGLCVCDVSTGEFKVTEAASINNVIDELAKYNPSEMIVSDNFDVQYINMIEQRYDIFINVLESWAFELGYCIKKITEHFNVASIDGLGLHNDAITCACGGVLEYLYRTQKLNLAHINNISIYSINNYMILDSNTRRNLELTETMREKSKKGSLLAILDKTVTSMGGRLIRKWIEQPLIDTNMINLRLDGIGELKENISTRQELRDSLKNVYDIERLTSRIVYGSVNGRDLIALKNSIAEIPGIKKSLIECNSKILNDLNNSLDELTDIFSLINSSINDEPPLTIKEGGVIKAGFNLEVDRLRVITTDSKSIIAEIENEEREKTGIKTLKVGYNKVFGYYVELSKSYTSLVPDYFIRKQTIANGERYIIPKLKEIEETILTAQSKLMELEYSIFNEIRLDILGQIKRIQKTSDSLANADAICSLSEVAYNNNYLKPEINSGETIEIIDGRHPVVEKMISNNLFVPNDTYLDNDENNLMIITGPNMAGKSTYMRQTALIVLMAQIGSFVPVTRASIGVVDRIFTRVGASDDLASGQSTFMVEMNEVSNILNNATARSLIILDEIGRGTSTFDGLSIAWAVVEYIANRDIIGAKTLFATHYHELTELEDKIRGVKNYCISVKERGDDIIFLRKIIRGGADGSYGIQVAKLAGLPTDVIDKAKEILKKLEEADINKDAGNKSKRKHIDGQVDLFSVSNGNSEIIEYLKNLEVTTISPIEALNELYKLAQKAKSS